MRIKRWMVSASLLGLACSDSYALNPVNGWYGGVFLGVSATKSSNFDFTPPVTVTGNNGSISAESGNLARSVLGDVGGQIGYRFCDRFRIEGEYLYNNNPFSTLTLTNVTLKTTYYSLTPPNQYTFNNVESSSLAHIQGDVNTGAFMANFLYDFFTPSQDGYSKVLPFIGGGIGISYVQNALQFYRPVIEGVSDPNREILTMLQTRTTWAGQVIAGIHLFLDDFTWFSVDARYFQTGSSNPKTEFTFITPTAVYKTHSSTNIFGSNTQLMSINVSFNGVLDFG